MENRVEMCGKWGFGMENGGRNGVKNGIGSVSEIGFSKRG